MIASTSKGLILGGSNVLAVAGALGFVEGLHSPHTAVDMAIAVTLLGMVPGLVVGGVLGYLAGRVTVHRFVLLATLALGAVAVLGALTEPGFIPFAAAPTLPLALALEHWTRADALRPRLPRAPMTSAAKGALLGAANVLATAIVIGVRVMFDPRRGWSGDGEELGFGFPLHVTAPAVGLEIGLVIGCIGIVPGVATGAALGRLADELRAWCGATRAAVLGTGAVAAVAAIGLLGHEAAFVVPACVPALVASFVLERWTRHADRLAPAQLIRW